MPDERSGVRVRVLQPAFTVCPDDERPLSVAILVKALRTCRILLCKDLRGYSEYFWRCVQKRHTELNKHDRDMDGSNPQHYQPLSHALRLPVGASDTISPSYTYIQKPTRHEEEEDEDDDEDVVQQQLSRDQDAQMSGPSSPKSSKSSAPDQSQQRQQQEPIIHQYEPAEQKRRPGRPRGSKNRRRESQPPTKPTPYPTANGSPQSAEVNPQNQQYYEFQWRVLQLCGEFYSAAEELVKGANPLVIAQCYHSGPENKVDPLAMLNDAKRVCDTLIANPARLITAPPPPMYPVIPTFYQPAGVVAPPPPPTAPAGPPTVINQPQSFVVSMGPPGQYPMYAPPPGPYQPGPYYHQYAQYQPPPPPGTAYFSVQPPPSGAPQPPASASSSTAPSSISVPPGGAGHQGAWSEEEIERLKKLAEESRSAGSNGEMDWDWVVTKFGNERSRHQILIKATSLGLKESSTRPLQARGVKRRRDGDEPDSPPRPPSTASPSGANSNTTPTESQGPATPAASPTAPKSSSSHSSHHQPPPSSKSSNLPWPMPTVAVHTTSPVVASSSVHDRDRIDYYRRPSESSKPIMGPAHSHHQFMYHPGIANGK